MLLRCFYLVALLTTTISVTFSQITLYPDGDTVAIGPVNLRVRNIVPQSVDWPSTRVNSTSSALVLSLDEPLVARFSLQVFFVFFYIPAKMEVYLSGDLNFGKNTTGGCGYNNFIHDKCSATARVVVRGTTSNRQLADVTINACDPLIAMLSSVMTPRPTLDYPPLAPGAADIARSTYFQKFLWGSALSELIGVPASAVFAARNAMRVSKGTVLPFELDFDTDDNRTAAAIDAGVRVVDLFKQLLNITTTSHANQTTSIPFMGGTVTVPTASNLVDQVLYRQARAALKTFVPARTSLVYDIVVNDFRCSLFGTICTLPAENPVYVINSHIDGAGDAGVILGNIGGARVDEVLTNITASAVRATSVRLGGRLYLSPI
ncbi:hypothetical protein NESM_000721300 [Novymonas esmeraldas]|uniref:Uncharacterized protein n=1 Tax=Novymonas esmeraldas TaxID=1808958 RepID=A0AAW0ETX0_9TRYP